MYNKNISMNTLSMTWDDLPNISMRAITGPNELPQCAIRWGECDCINLALLPDKKVAVLRADLNLPDAAVRALGRTISRHQGAFVASGGFPPDGGAGVKWHPPAEIPWGEKKMEVTFCTIYQSAEIARLFIVSDPRVPTAGMQFKSAPSDDMWRTVARLLLQHRASLPGAGEGDL